MIFKTISDCKRTDRSLETSGFTEATAKVGQIVHKKCVEIPSWP